MANNLTVEIKEITERLNKIAYDYGVEINKKTILKRAGKVTLLKLKENAKVDTGALRDSMAFLSFRKDKTGVYVGPRYHTTTNSEGEARNAIAPHAHLVEFGFISKAGNRIKGKPFIKQTYEQTKNQVLKNLENEIVKIQSRLEKKYGKA